MKKKSFILLNVLANPDNIFKKKRFIISAFNLAFLAFVSDRSIEHKNSYIMWPDGVFSQFFLKTKKLPGYQLIEKLKIPKNIKKIVVLGNLETVEKKFLKILYNKKIVHNKISKGSIIKIIKDINFQFSDKNLYIITLPTPKQEQIANFISKKINNYKIICIGGGLSIASGRIERTPKLLSKFGLEWAWRLKTDTGRRLIRLIYTFSIFLFSYFGRRMKFKIRKV